MRSAKITKADCWKQNELSIKLVSYQNNVDFWIGNSTIPRVSIAPRNLCFCFNKIAKNFIGNQICLFFRLQALKEQVIFIRVGFDLYTTEQQKKLTNKWRYLPLIFAHTNYKKCVIIVDSILLVYFCEYTFSNQIYTFKCAYIFSSKNWRKRNEKNGSRLVILLSHTHELSTYQFTLSPR